MNPLSRITTAMSLGAGLLLLALSTAGFAGQHHMDANGTMVGGAMMSPSKTIVQNASKADNLTTLVAAVKAAGLVDTLSSEGPFTVFAPTNAAFEKLPDGTVKTLLKDKNKDKLTAILTYHVLPMKVTASELKFMIKDSGGKVSATTVQGAKLWFKLEGGNIVIIDAAGNTAGVVQANVMQSNGVVHVIDTVLMPPM